MIRRDATNDDGSPAWVLITQTEHARLAGVLAEHWGAAPFGPLQPRSVVLPTVYRHDDGWAGWERQPTIDPANGRPRSFTEMPSDAAHAIWRRSIESVADLGPLAQYIVAQHFMRLRRGGAGLNDPQVSTFLDEFDRRCRDWLAAWQVLDPQRHTPELAESAVDYLQAFDALSLVLCCTPWAGTKSMSTPLGRSISLSPHGDAIAVSPWPWTVSSLSVSALGQMLPAQPLDSDEQLHQRLAAAPGVELTWKLRRPA